MTDSKLYDTLQDSNIFLSGGAGVGKSYLTSKIIKLYQSNDKKVIPLGSTGISAVNIGGFTLHSFFIFGLASNIDELRLQDRKNRKRVTELKKAIKEIDLIIIDEISMVSARLMDMVYYRLDTLGYDGRLMVVGDFYQLPPIQKSREDNALFKEEVYAFESSAWLRFEFNSIILKEVKRTSDREFIDILSDIREGRLNSTIKSYLNNLMGTNFPAGIEPTYLFGRNREVEEMNREKLSKLDGEEALFFWNIQKHKDVNEKRLSSWCNSLPVIDALHLKVGAPVIFTINKWGKYVNGQKGIVVDFDDDYIVVRSRGRDIRVDEHDFDMYELDIDNAEPIAVATLSQYPIKLAYAITIHKSQGMSIDSLVCNLDYIFTPGQLYVAISRAVEPKLLKIDFNGFNLDSYLDRVVTSNEIVDNFYSELVDD